MDYQKVKRYYSLFKLFFRLLLAFINPFHELWMDDKVFKVWDLALKSEEAIQKAAIIQIYMKNIDELISEMMARNGIQHEELDAIMKQQKNK